MKPLKKEDLSNYLSGEGSRIVGLCLIDIDYFKRYIAFHGQLEGDRCFVQVANCLGTVMGNHKGFLSHSSEDKFICLLTDINSGDFACFAENLRVAVENLSLKFCWEQHSFQLTLSVGGVHGLVSQFKDKEEMLAIADERLHQAKSNGYNNVKIKFK